MDLLLESLMAEWQRLLQILPRIGIALVAVIISVMVGRLIGRGVEQVVRRSDLPNTHGSFFRKVVVWVFVFFGLLVSLNLLGLRTLAAGLMTGGGVTAVVLGFAFREIGENFLAGFFLAFSRPFKVGDLIESNGLRGTVQSIELRYTHVRSADGRDIFIPSSQLFKEALVNFTRDGLRRFSFTVGIDYADDPQRAVELLRPAVGQCGGVLGQPQSGVIVSGLLDAWVQLEVFYWINTFDSAHSIGSVQTGVLGAVRSTLRDAGYTLSNDTSTALGLHSLEPIQLVTPANQVLLDGAD